MLKLFVTFTSAVSALAQRGRRLSEDRGAAAVEYGMLVALIAAVVVGTVALLGPTIKAAFQAVVTALTDAIGGGSPTP